MLTGEKNEETVSRVLCAVFCPRTAISLGRTFPSASSDLDPRASGGPPFSRGVLRGVALLFGLAPGGVCRAATVARRAVSSYLTFSPLPPGPGKGRMAVSFLWHCPRGRPHRGLPGTLPCGARTFLPPAIACAQGGPAADWSPQAFCK